ncbi:hypothetical protein BCR44DRAFT_1189966 [Catenaria anguillulae PL171]|uniref:Uncharacterized protein n=1 Tax=Catenaria anguillulae PL171 TaxID=765915 RepID=A0A1Y2HGK7_9FUNG|nr:hypothetical protein BCR44DRAFT_1189966 [Catenaria anguillulae PL171]
MADATAHQDDARLLGPESTGCVNGNEMAVDGIGSQDNLPLAVGLSVMTHAEGCPQSSSAVRFRRLQVHREESIRFGIRSMIGSHQQPVQRHATNPNQLHSSHRQDHRSVLPHCFLPTFLLPHSTLKYCQDLQVTHLRHPAQTFQNHLLHSSRTSRQCQINRTTRCGSSSNKRSGVCPAADRPSTRTEATSDLGLDCGCVARTAGG